MNNIYTTMRRFINSRPGLDFGNYGDIKSYRQELRGIMQDRRDALALLDYCEYHNIRPDFGAFSGRLQYDDATNTLSYCAGQYYPTEYRAAVAACCASAIWYAYRAEGVYSDGNAIRKAAMLRFGRGIARRWFN